jgi:hypothetical protein
LPHTLAQLCDGLVTPIAKAYIFESLFHPALAFRARHVPKSRKEEQIIGQGHLLVQASVFEDDADALSYLLPVARRVHAQNPDRTSVWED